MRHGYDMCRRLRTQLLVSPCFLLAVGCGGGHKGTPVVEPEPDGEEMHRFENPEEWAKIFDDPARDAWQHPDEIVTLLAPAAGMTVADIGAGTGYFLSRLSRAVGEGGIVIGTDIEPNMVQYMTGRAEREALGNVRPVLAAPDDPTLPAAGVDRVLVVDVWHHISGDAAARITYGKKLAATLRPGGAVMIVDFTPESAMGPPKQHRIPAPTVVAELTAAGLVAEIADETLPEQYVVIGRRP